MRQVVRGIDQRDVRKSLGKVSDHSVSSDVVLFREQPELPAIRSPLACAERAPDEWANTKQLGHIRRDAEHRGTGSRQVG